MSTKNHDLPPEAADLKAQANDNFHQGDFPKAYALFTSALKISPTSPVLFSNRSAVAIKLKRYTDALLDAEQSVNLDPNWERAHGRVATAQHCLGRYELAVRSFQRAEALASSAASKAGYAARITEVHADSEALHSVPDSRITPFMRLEALRAQGFEYGPYSAAVRDAYVSTRVTEYWKLCQELTSDKDVSLDRDANISGPPDIWNAIIGLSVAFLDDPSISPAMPPHPAWDHPVKLVFAMESFVRKAWGIGVISGLNGQDAESLMRRLDSIQTEYGWEDVRAGEPGAKSLLAGMLCTRALIGMLSESIMLNHENALNWYKFVDALITAAKARWPDEIDNILAEIGIRRTFQRVIQSRMLGCRIALSVKFQDTKSLDEANRTTETAAKAILKMCQDDPIPKPPPSAPTSDIVNWIGHDAWLRAEAYTFFGLEHGTRAEDVQRRTEQFVYMDKNEARASVENSRQALEWFPEDDRRFALGMWSVLEMQMRGGDVTLEELDQKISAAQRSERAYERYHGKDTPQEPTRDYVLRTRERLFLKAAQHHVTNPAKIVLNPIPRFVTPRSPDDPSLAPILDEIDGIECPNMHPGNTIGPGVEKTRFTLVDVFKAPPGSNEWNTTMS